MVAIEEFAFSEPHESEPPSRRLPNESTSSHTTGRSRFGRHGQLPVVATVVTSPTVGNAGPPPPVPNRPPAKPVASPRDINVSTIISAKLASLTHRVRPVSGKRYFIHNVGRGRWLNLAHGHLHERAPIIAWPKDPSHGNNEIWLFTEKTGLFTLKSRHAMMKGEGGYLTIEWGKSVLRHNPMQWKIEEVADNAYRFLPVGNVALAALTSEVNVKLAQARVIRKNRMDERQQWVFVEAPPPADCHRPVSDREYFVMNVGRARWLDLPRPGGTENIVIAWRRNENPTANQAWRVTLFDDSKITLQSVHALRAEGYPNGNQGGPGGHLHIKDGKTVLMHEPFFWKLSDTGDKMYRFKPYDLRDSLEDTLTAVTDSLGDYRNNQAVMQTEVDEDETQYWAFIPVRDPLQ